MHSWSMLKPYSFRGGDHLIFLVKSSKISMLWLAQPIKAIYYHCSSYSSTNFGMNDPQNRHLTFKGGDQIESELDTRYDGPGSTSDPWSSSLHLAPLRCCFALDVWLKIRQENVRPIYKKHPKNLVTVNQPSDSDHGPNPSNTELW
jgi:hypothetical protein